MQRYITPKLPAKAGFDARIMVVGECAGENDIQYGEPFMGYTGKELTRMLAEAGIAREECYLTTVFKFKPFSSIDKDLCVKKKEADELWQDAGFTGKYPIKPIKAGSYVKPEYLQSIADLHEEIISYNPNVIIALGNVALWALTGEAGITKVRGTILETDFESERPYKVISTYHPSYIMKKWDDRPVVIADFMKAKRESKSPTYTRPKRELWIQPTLPDIKDFVARYLMNADFAVDIETAYNQITCIGFGTKTHAICIPFVDESKRETFSYWDNKDDEIEAWSIVRKVLHLDGAKIFQNGMYDMQWLWVLMGMYPKGKIEDTMLLHHSMYPEMSKGLGFLSSIYTNETSWKRLRPRKRTTDKKDDE